MKRNFLPLLTLALVAATAQAEIKSKLVEYKQDGATLEGLSVYDDAIEGKRPAVLVIHQWKGLGDYEKKRAEMLAKLGYNVFAVDIYGKGIRPTNPKDAAAEAAKYKNDRPCLRARATAGLEAVPADAFTDWTAGNGNSKGAAYNEKGDKRAWEAMKQFFSELFR